MLKNFKLPKRNNSPDEGYDKDLTNLNLRPLSIITENKNDSVTLDTAYQLKYPGISITPELAYKMKHHEVLKKIMTDDIQKLPLPEIPTFPRQQDSLKPHRVALPPKTKSKSGSSSDSGIIRNDYETIIPWDNITRLTVADFNHLYEESKNKGVDRPDQKIASMFISRLEQLLGRNLFSDTKPDSDKSIVKTDKILKDQPTSTRGRKENIETEPSDKTKVKTRTRRNTKQVKYHNRKKQVYIMKSIDDSKTSHSKSRSSSLIGECEELNADKSCESIIQPASVDENVYESLIFEPEPTEEIPSKSKLKAEESIDSLIFEPTPKPVFSKPKSRPSPLPPKLNLQPAQNYLTLQTPSKSSNKSVRPRNYTPVNPFREPVPNWTTLPSKNTRDSVLLPPTPPPPLQSIPSIYTKSLGEPEYSSCSFKEDSFNFTDTDKSVLTAVSAPTYVPLKESKSQTSVSSAKTAASAPLNLFVSGPNPSSYTGPRFDTFDSQSKNVTFMRSVSDHVPDYFKPLTFLPNLTLPAKTTSSNHTLTDFNYKVPAYPETDPLDLDTNKYTKKNKKKPQGDKKSNLSAIKTSRFEYLKKKAKQTGGQKKSKSDTLFSRFKNISNKI